ncbi:MAG: class I SAM-dependent methyltransferase [Candidatus Wallbacteria bacterium]|nr:class I SAM-dependent methyltransferase [Candidatus Wallbacteria bacterium]
MNPSTAPLPPHDSRLCPACLSQEFSVLPQSTGPSKEPLELAFELLECRGCALVRIVHRMSDDAMAAYCGAFDSARQEGISQKEIQGALRSFDRRSAVFAGLEPGRLLDVGCGPGYFLEVMRRKGWTVEGLEPFGASAEHAGALAGAVVHHASLEEFRPQQRYRLVTLWHVLEHTLDPVQALRHCCQLLEPGGALFFEVPNIDGLEARLSGSFWLALREPTHHWMFRPEALRLLAKRAQVNLSDVRAVGSSAGWYGIKRGLRGRIWRQDYIRSKMAGGLPAPGPAAKVAGSLLTLYPLTKLLAWAGAVAGAGDVLQGWCAPLNPP